MKTESEKYYNENAQKDCRECNGKGMVLAFYAQDVAKLEPCPRCFQKKPDVIRMENTKS